MSNSRDARYRVASASSTSASMHAILRGSTGENRRASSLLASSRPSSHRVSRAPAGSDWTSSGAAARVKTCARSSTRTASAPPRDLRPIHPRVRPSAPLSLVVPTWFELQSTTERIDVTRGCFRLRHPRVCWILSGTLSTAGSLESSSSTGRSHHHARGRPVRPARSHPTRLA